MKELEQYIKENRSAFDEGNLPIGSKERFMRKLHVSGEKEKDSENKMDTMVKTGENPLKSNKIKSIDFKPIIKVLGNIAAVFILAFFISHFSKEEQASTEPDYPSLMVELGNKIISLNKESDQQTTEQMIKAMDDIIFEAIPLADQLPDEISEEEKARILREYYKRKNEGLKKIKTFLAQQTIETEE